MGALLGLFCFGEAVAQVAVVVVPVCLELVELESLGVLSTSEDPDSTSSLVVFELFPVAW